MCSRSVSLMMGAVTPLAGVWIEIGMKNRVNRVEVSHPPRGGVDRNMIILFWERRQICHPPRGGVDRNLALVRTDRQPPSHPPRGGVDRNLHKVKCLGILPSHPPRGGVDRNTILILAETPRRVTPLAGVWIEIFWLVDPVVDCWSPPSRGCGSKSQDINPAFAELLSPPSRGCGSK